MSDTKTDSKLEVMECPECYRVNMISLGGRAVLDSIKICEHCEKRIEGVYYQFCDHMTMCSNCFKILSDTSIYQDEKVLSGGCLAIVKKKFGSEVGKTVFQLFPSKQLGNAISFGMWIRRNDIDEKIEILSTDICRGYGRKLGQYKIQQFQKSYRNLGVTLAE
ncbi:MAG: hypothetical protein Harvfovirus41_9 [Harvfovirus sp.]|uniref:Uncharacterized protein n=1 Tax=Harvfovirus sp. TaxID=2487768 RepID=A0A3G5A4Y7_9VIRU|nr:MAG: hypothetical protein Harvfovirus41_9 [Harvfovirus sp.]